MQTQVVFPPDQLNDVDRALHESTPAAAPAQATAPAEAPVARAAPVVASGGESSTWDQTSLIGKDLQSVLGAPADGGPPPRACFMA